MSTILTDVKGENVSVSVKNQSGSRIAIDISVTPQATHAAYAKAVKSINKEVSFPGFRKGKAPDHMISQKYDKEVRSEWLDLVINIGFQEALQLLRVRPYREDSIKCSSVKELSLEKGATYSVEFELAPSVPKIKVNEIALEEIRSREVTQEDIDKVIENVRMQQANWVKVEDRKVQEDDYVDLTILKLDEPEEFICEDERFHVKKGMMMDWMRNLIIGLHPNESAEGISELDPDQERNDDFKPTKCRLTVGKIYSIHLLDNEALSVRCGATDFTGLQNQIKEYLEKQIVTEVHERKRRQLEDYLLNQYHFELPDSLLELETERRIVFAKEQLEEEEGLTEDEIKERLPEIREDARLRAERSCRLVFLMYAVSQENKIEVSQEEIAEQMMRQHFSQRNLDVEQFREIEAQTHQSILIRKAEDFLIKHAKGCN